MPCCKWRCTKTQIFSTILFIYFFPPKCICATSDVKISFAVLPNNIQQKKKLKYEKSFAIHIFTFAMNPIGNVRKMFRFERIGLCIIFFFQKKFLELLRKIPTFLCCKKKTFEFICIENLL